MIDPCGMVMDLARYTYDTDFRLYANSPDKTPVRWYRCLPGAKTFPSIHCFGNNFFYTIEENQTTSLGEVLDDRTYTSQGTIPTATGQKYCGTEYQFLHGVPFLPHDPPIQRDSYGIPLCCSTPSETQYVKLQYYAYTFVGPGVQTYAFVPGPGVPRIRFRCAGAGGLGAAGFPGVLPQEFRGGGGGAYAVAEFDVTPSAIYFVNFQCQPTVSGAYTGADCWVTDLAGNVLCYAQGGNVGDSQDLSSPPRFGGGGGQAAFSFGDTVKSGGDGGAGVNGGVLGATWWQSGGSGGTCADSVNDGIVGAAGISTLGVLAKPPLPNPGNPPGILFGQGGQYYVLGGVLAYSQLGRNCTGGFPDWEGGPGQALCGGGGSPPGSGIGTIMQGWCSIYAAYRIP
jgi:hypothetical protein